MPKLKYKFIHILFLQQNILMPEIYLYSPIYDFVAENLISALDENIGTATTLRVNSPGGGVFSNYGICAKLIEHGEVTIKVDGAAMSSAANLLPYAKRVECLDVSTFLLHRADMFVESVADQAFLDKINKDLKAKLLLKIDSDKFKEVTGFTIAQLFDSENRLDVILSASEARQIGLVDKVNKLTPAEVTAFNNKMFQVAAVTEDNQTKTNQKQINKMDIQKLKAEHPEVYAQVIALGVEKEKDRVEACLAFLDVDTASVKEAIASGKDLSQKQMAEFFVKATSKNALAEITANAANPVTTTELPLTEATAEVKNLDAFKAEYKSLLKVK